MKDKKSKLEEIEGSHTLGGAVIHISLSYRMKESVCCACVYYESRKRELKIRRRTRVGAMSVFIVVCFFAEGKQLFFCFKTNRKGPCCRRMLCVSILLTHSSQSAGCCTSWQGQMCVKHTRDRCAIIWCILRVDKDTTFERA